MVVPFVRLLQELIGIINLSGMHRSELLGIAAFGSISVGMKLEHERFVSLLHLRVIDIKATRGLEHTKVVNARCRTQTSHARPRISHTHKPSHYHLESPELG
jgi:hypothetical protein